MPGCGSPGERGEKKSGIDPVSRTADWPGQTLNVDLCFVPVSHLADVKLPAVSGSSGHLVVERVKEVGQEPDYPGKVFADLELGYAEAIQAFVAASQPLFGPKIGAVGAEKTPWMRLERYRQRGLALRTSHAQGGGNNGAVAKVDAIEIAHRHHRSLWNGGRGRGVADIGKARRHFRDSLT